MARGSAMHLAGLLLAVLIINTGLFISAGGPPARAQSGARWEVLPVEIAAGGSRLMAPASGALFLIGPNGELQRSDDGGVSWRDVALPPAASGKRKVVEVDPTSHLTLFADGAEGLYRTTDDAATWQVVRPAGEVVHVRVSPADPSVVYALDGPSSAPLAVYRSGDGGTTWREVSRLDLTHFEVVKELWLHPTDPERIVVATERATGSPDLAGWMRETTDGGTTWHVWGPDAARRTLAVAGGHPTAPTRLFALTTWLGDIDPGLRGSSSLRDANMTWAIYRSDDDGATWTALDPRTPTGQRRGPGRVAPPLVVDPTNPDRLFGIEPGQGPTVSTDAGSTWAPLGENRPKNISALALGIDGTNLYAAGFDGRVYRVALR